MDTHIHTHRPSLLTPVLTPSGRLKVFAEGPTGLLRFVSSEGEASEQEQLLNRSSFSAGGGRGGGVPGDHPSTGTGRLRPL